MERSYLMFGKFPDSEVMVYFQSDGSSFLKIKNFLFRKIWINPENARIYFLDENSGELLSELSVKWKGNEEKVEDLLRNNLLKSFSAKVILSGSFKLLNENCVFIAERLKVRSSREKIKAIFGELVKLKDPNEPKPKSHSCD